MSKPKGHPHSRAPRAAVSVWMTVAFLGALVSQAFAAQFRQPGPGWPRDVFLWTDTCNVYVVRDGDAALLIDLGDGSVLDHLAEIGVRRVEWVLFTHHHREQNQGYPRLAGTGARIAGPEAERALFERPGDFRKMRVRLGDAFTVHGASYVRPPIQPIPLDRSFKAMDTFRWHNRDFRCVDTRGNSPGSMTYLCEDGGRWLAFSGDLMLAGARMHTWFDTEWDYGFASGVWAIHNSAAQVAGYAPLWLLPSHGTPVREPKAQLAEYQAKLQRLERLLVRGYDVQSFAAASQDKVSKPTAVPHIWQISPHLYKFRGPNYFVNFNMILADSGHGLVVDCGLMDSAFLDTAIEGMRQKLGLKQIDAVVLTHMHGDHFLQAPHMKEKWGAGLWGLDRMAPMVEHPERFDYAAPIQAYGTGIDGVRFDRVFKPGSTLEWEGFKLGIDWMPGQTEFALCLHGKIDGKLVAFTGDNIFGDPDNPKHTGHEAMVAHNSGILEEGYIYGAEYLKRLRPDILVGGHSYVMDRPARFIERYRQWSYRMRDAFRALSNDPDYRYWFDPFWVRAEPCRVRVRRGDSADIQVWIRNFRRTEQTHRVEIHAPAGLSAEPATLDDWIPRSSRDSFPVRLHASANAAPGVHIVALDITLDGHRLGEWFDLTVEVTAE